MFEIPECLTLARQMNESILGKRIVSGNLGNSPHKFVWYNRSPEEFAQLVQDKSVGRTTIRGRWMFTAIEPGYVLVLGECGGKVLYHKAGAKEPKKMHLQLRFEDDSFFTVTTQMWGGMELYEEGDELEGKYVKGMLTTPAEEAFTFDYFDSLLDDLIPEKSRSIKSLLTQEQTIPGLGNAIAQDIMFKSCLHPKYPIQSLDHTTRERLYQAIVEVVREITAKGGRYDEFDLHGQRGGYVRLMDKKTAGKPCPNCGTLVKKIQYLGGACYLCPSCQAM
jgi:formamidopyrimidine-DNA glycosylase